MFWRKAFIHPLNHIVAGRGEEIVREEQEEQEEQEARERERERERDKLAEYSSTRKRILSLAKVLMEFRAVENFTTYKDDPEIRMLSNF